MTHSLSALEDSRSRLVVHQGTLILSGNVDRMVKGMEGGILRIR